MENIEIDLKSPINSPEFKVYWASYVSQISERENFKEGHLVQLRILIDLLIDYDDLTKFIRENGWSYSTESRNGMQQKQFVETGHRQKTINQIRDYCKLLDITLAKDTDIKEDNSEKWD